MPCSSGTLHFMAAMRLEIIRLVERCAPPDLRSLDSGIPEFLSAIIMRLLRKDPAERIQSAAELADVLNRHLTMINQTKSDEQGRIPLTAPLQTASLDAPHVPVASPRPQSSP